MDTIPPDDFIGIFHRICQYVRLGRVRNHQEIKKRIKHTLNLMRKAMRTGKRGSTVRKWSGNFRRLRILYRHNIHERIWDEAVDNPDGFIDLTLDHGYDRARKILEERAKRRARRMERI